MFRIHKEGAGPISVASILLLLLLLLVHQLFWASYPWIVYGAAVILAPIWIWVISFFRNPKRKINADPNAVVAPADGKVVVIEDVPHAEYFGDTRKQISIFMSPFNVHFNKVPVTGPIVYRKYYPGKYLVAWHPKSSELNERMSVVILNEHLPVLVRQIAGAMARRIRNYMSLGDVVEQGEELGFIKFGSRVDVLLPADVEVTVELGQQVKANQTIIAKRKT